MSTVYLYVKQHSVTGLKYFGKTTNDPYKYMGSGKYWIRHIKKYGKQHVVTLNVWAFDDLLVCSKFATNFSIENDIVESTVWANLAPENGTDGGFRPNSTIEKYNQQPRSISHINNISQALKGNRNACKRILIEGVIYPSKIEAARIYNVTPEAFQYWIKKGKASFVTS